MEITDILQQLGISTYANVFEKNGITMELIKDLNEKLIAELIPEVGPRIVFLSYWKKNFSQTKKTSSVASSVANSVGTSVTSSDAETNSIENNQNALNTCNKNAIQETNTCENSSKRKLHELYEEDASTSQDTFLLETIPSIEDLLQRSKTGRIILCGPKNKELTGSMRNKLCNIIITYMQDNNIVMTNEIAKVISKRIVKLFPSEAEGTYFIEGKKKIHTPDKKSLAAKGKLLSCWRNRKYALSQLTKLTQEDDIDNLDDNLDVSNEDIQKALDWLKINQAPWEIVLEKWHLTSKYRLQVLAKSSDKRLTNILEEWPLLKHPYGYKLITYDFDQMQLTNFCLTSEKWNEFFSTIKQYVQGPSKNDDFSNLIETLDLDISEDSKLAITIQLLSYMIPPKQKAKQKRIATRKTYNKASIAMSRDSMIKYVTTSADITKIRQEAIDEAKETQTSVQPYIIVVGSISNVSNTYVTIDEISREKDDRRYQAYRLKASHCTL
ncbi:uncharacterized protein [Temnothorax nylanderi]|uniref:uncharacterized protein isoform X2 n=1 Tax=Temnothorax nylanderi TaxID=102681 RepID=UPI003A86EC6F